MYWFLSFFLPWSKNKEYPLESYPPIKYEKEISVTCKPTPIFCVQYSGKYRLHKKCSCVSVQKEIQNLCGIVSKDWRFSVDKFTENLLEIPQYIFCLIKIFYLAKPCKLLLHMQQDSIFDFMSFPFEYILWLSLYYLKIKSSFTREFIF